MDKAQILVVEDESIVALDLQKKLMRLGYGVPALAASGVEAIAQADRLQPDLILMDIRLKGDMDGIEAADYIRTRLNLPIIYLTAYADEATLQRAKLSQPYGYLLKPLVERELQTGIEMALYRHHLEQKLLQSEQWLSAVLNSIGEAIIATDEQGRVKFMNPVAETLTGWSQAESLGRDLSQVFNLVVDQSPPPGENPMRHVIDNETVLELRSPIRLMTKNGPGIYIEDSFAPIKSEGQVSGAVLVFRDISERQRLAEALHEKQEIYRSLYENNHSIMLLIDPITGAVIDANPAACTFYGYSKEEITQKKMAEISVLSKEQILDDMVRAKVENRKYLYLQHQLANGEIRDVEVYRGPIEVQGKQLVYSIIHDITDHRRTEEALARSHELYTALSRIQARFIQETDTRIRFEEMLRVLLELTKSEYGFLGEVLYTADGQPYLKSHAVSDISWNEETRAAFGQQILAGMEFHNLKTLFRAILTSGDPIIANNPANDPHWSELPAQHPHLRAFLGLPFHHGEEMIGMVGLANRPGGYDQALADWLEPVLATCTSLIIADRHERHRREAEDEIRRRNQELTLLNQVIAASASGVEAAEILKTACHALGQALEVPAVTATLFNNDKTSVTVMAEHLTEGQSSILGTDISITSHPLFQHLLTHSSTSLVIDNLSQEPHLAPGHLGVRWFDTGSLLMLPMLVAGEVIGSLNLESPELYRFSTPEINLAWRVADQGASALARIQLDKEHRQLSAAIEQTAESVVITDTDGKIIYVNPAFEQVTGYSRAEAVAQNPRLLKSHKHPAAFYEGLWATISSGLVWQGRFTNKKKDGTLYIEDITITPVRDKRGQIVNYVGVGRDVTREQQLEEQYRQAQKMEAVGLLAGGIAHDFNNILTVINGYTELVCSELPPDNPLQETLGTILQSGNRATNLVRQLLAFSRKQIIQPRVLELNLLVLELNKMLRRVISENIHIETNLAPDLWPIKADPHQIEQIILNLAVNAQDAMPQGGHLTIETANVILAAEDVASYPEVEPGEYVLLAVHDTGLGMNEEVKARIFEPFFTTKELGQGTGLGLATVYGIIKQNKGNIWVDSAENQGTTFKVYLPRASTTATLPSPVDSSETLPRGAETILLVEDEEAVREFIALVLREQGYTVIEAANGQEALRLAREYPSEIHLLLTDMVMPGISGMVLAQCLQKDRPNLKILIMSGYSTQLSAYPGTGEGTPPFIQKPFSRVALLGKIRDRFNQNDQQMR